MNLEEEIVLEDVQAIVDHKKAEFRRLLKEKRLRDTAAIMERRQPQPDSTVDTPKENR
jgi:hypothetical protein